MDARSPGWIIRCRTGAGGVSDVGGCSQGIETGISASIATRATLRTTELMESDCEFVYRNSWDDLADIRSDPTDRPSSAGVCQVCGKHAPKRYGGMGRYLAMCIDCWEAVDA